MLQCRCQGWNGWLAKLDQRLRGVEETHHRTLVRERLNQRRNARSIAQLDQVEPRIEADCVIITLERSVEYRGSLCVLS
jgi:hypothetical protein